MSLFWRSVRGLEALGRATRPIVRSLRYFHPKVQRFGVAPVVCFAIEDGLERAYFVLCKARRLCYTLRRANPRFRLFLGSSAVEHSTVNRMVAGSNPARGANEIKSLHWILNTPVRRLFSRRPHWGPLRRHCEFEHLIMALPVHTAHATIQAPIRSVRLQRGLIAPFFTREVQ
jgi:hypothetical protein